MTTNPLSYYRHRFPPDIISHAVWVYHRFCLSFREVEDLLAQRWIIVSYETIRQWCRKFGAEYAHILRHREGRLGDIWYLDELFVKIQGQRQYLWRAVDQDGDVIDILLQPRRDQHAAERFFRKLLKGRGCVPWRLVTDKLRSYSAAHQTVLPSVIHNTIPGDKTKNGLSHRVPLTEPALAIIREMKSVAVRFSKSQGRCAYQQPTESSGADPKSHKDRFRWP
jgi:putative transposase